MTPAALGDFPARKHVAYFSMEIALRPEIHTYAGGLGVLAGDTVRSCADLDLPLVFVTLASRAGYFRQEIERDGRQAEHPDAWDPAQFCTALDPVVAATMEGRAVWLRPWLYVQESPSGRGVPVIILDSRLDANAPEDQALTDSLYGGDTRYRLKQEVVLGVGGDAVLRALGFAITTYHLNEGHAALLTLALLRRTAAQGSTRYDAGSVRQRCVFTTHTPVEAGHDHFTYALFESVLPGFLDAGEVRRHGGQDHLNLTRLALNLSGFVNGVGARHAETTTKMFPGYQINAIDNGVHHPTWTHAAFAELYSRHMPRWQHEPEVLVGALDLADDEVWRCHAAAKADLVQHVASAAGVALDPARPILGFARRMTGYKRPLLLFSDVERLFRIARRFPLQIVVAGKAHPRDMEGKEAIRRIHELADALRDRIGLAYLPDYDLRSARTIVAGCDAWLNTPLPPLEASGTSGMKAALNGVLNVSVLDGWWTEACVEGVTGWAIGTDRDGRSDLHAESLYAKLEQLILPLWFEQPAQWRTMMKQSVARIGSHFNTHRMMRRYVTDAYLRSV